MPETMVQALSATIWFLTGYGAGAIFTDRFHVVNRARLKRKKRRDG